MEILKEYTYRNMKKIKYDINDIDLIKKRFSNIKKETFDLLFEALNDFTLLIEFNMKPSLNLLAFLMQF